MREKPGRPSTLWDEEFNVIPQESGNWAISKRWRLYERHVLEGAKWDYEHGYLAEPNPMELFSPMPIIHFKPAMAKKKPPRGTYQCPCYMYPIRSGTRERPSYVLNVNLKGGQQSNEYWIKEELLYSLVWQNKVKKYMDDNNFFFHINN